jgi:hypothetical protein
MRKVPTTPYLTGFDVKPSSTSVLGVVTFTDGTHTIIPNQVQCEAYGYTYDKASGTCSIFRFNTNLNRSFSNESNKFQGANNTTETGTNNTQIIGENNTVKGLSRNNIVVGNQNEIANGVNNASVFGINGNATRQSEFNIGGGLNEITTGSDTAYADRQLGIINLSGTTSDNTATTLTVNNQDSKFINIKNNCILGWEIYMTRLEVGGSAGTAGNYSYRNEKGVVRIDDSYGMTFTVGYTRNIGKLGVNGTYAMIDSTTGGVPSISIQVSDRNNVDNIWSATVYVHELISTNVTF